MPSSGKIATLLLTGIFCTQTATALIVRGYSASRHNRFTGYPANPVANPNFLYAAFDFSGVGWNTSSTNFQYTLVSPMHFVGANHARPGIGHNLRFVATDGTIRDYTVAATTAIKNSDNENTDLFVGRLTTPVASSHKVNHHPYLNLSNESSYNGLNLMFFGKPARAGSQTIDHISTSSSTTTNSTRTLRSIYIISAGSDDEAYLQGGDSGSPAFVPSNGIAAIVGTHSLVGTGNTTIVNHSNFIPHYIDELNTIMANHGYHMSKATPGFTSLSLQRQITTPGPLRAGHPVDIQLTLTNTGLTTAENLRLTNSFPAGTIVNSITATDWHDQSSLAAIEGRRASLNTSATTTYTLNLTIPTPGTHQQSITRLSDQSTAVTENFSITVIESYLSWASALSDTSTTGNDDNDNLNNLLEYAFGGDPTVNSPYFPGTTIPLIPQFNSSGNNHQLSFIRRTDHGQRALSYSLQSSHTMTADSWSDASAQITQTTLTPINSDFERVTYTFSTNPQDTYYRLKITLSE